MDDYLDINKLKDQSLKYQTDIEQHTEKEDVMGLVYQLSQQFSEHVLSIIITNFHRYKKGHEAYYVLKLTRQQIEILEINPTTRNNILFLFQQDEVYVNNRQMGKVYHTALVKRIREIITDVKIQKAFVFEEHVEE